MGVWFQHLKFGRDTYINSVASNLLYPCLCPKRQICLDSINGLSCCLVFNLFQSIENADQKEEESSQETVLLHPPCGVAIKRPFQYDSKSYPPLCLVHPPSTYPFRFRHDQAVLPLSCSGNCFHGFCTACPYISVNSCCIKFFHNCSI